MYIDIIDLNGCPTNERNGTYGGQAGSKEGITIDNEYWIVKYPKSTRGMRTRDISYTTSPLSEFLGSQIYEILGYDVHKTILGFRNNKIVVACKDFCEKEGSLREIRVLKNTYNKKLEHLLETRLSSTGSDNIVDLDEIKLHLENNPILSDIDGLQERFWDCVVVDGLINNNDRNNGNWGLLYKDGDYKLAPIYDNGAAFSNKISDIQIEKRMKNRENLEIGALAIETVYGISDRKLKFRDILMLEDIALREAIKMNVPLIQRNIKTIEAMINAVPEQYKGMPVISPERKAFYIEGMKIRLEQLLVPAYERIVDERSISKAVKAKKQCR